MMYELLLVVLVLFLTFSCHLPDQGIQGSTHKPLKHMYNLKER